MFAVEILALDGSTGLDVSVQHKNLEDTSWVTLGSMSPTAVGVTTLSVGGIKEEVRLAFSVNGSTAQDSVYANVLDPQWRPY